MESPAPRLPPEEIPVPGHPDSPESRLLRAAQPALQRTLEPQPGNRAPRRAPQESPAAQQVRWGRPAPQLAAQPGGASVALRKLVEEARRANEGKDRVRKAQEAAYRFLSAMGGNLPGFEEANRALFAGDSDRFDREVADWPADVREHATEMARAAFRPAAG